MKLLTLSVGAIGGAWVGVTLPTQAEAWLIGFCFFTVTSDFITGIAASFKEGKPITSRKIRESVYKVIAFLSAVLLSWVTQQVNAMYPTSWQFPILSTVLGVIFTAELWSNIENIRRLSGWDLKVLNRVLEGIKKEAGAEDKSKEDEP